MGGSVPTIPGNKADHSLASGFRYEVAGLLGRKQTTFPGAQPVSFAAKHLTELQSQDYYVCEKTDGIRCLMYLTHDGPQEVVYLIDRKNDYYHVPGLHFPVKGSETEFHKNTIVDGELVNDTLPDGTVQMKYLVFDCMVLDGKVLMHRTLDKRLAYFRENVFFPYEGLYKKYPGEEEFLPFILKFKQMELGYAIEKMFTEVLPNLQHGNDGLIFTCRNSPYTPGTDERILKWKTKSENSIDFRMHFRFPMVEPDSDDEDEEGAYPDYTAMPQVYLTVFGGDNADDKFMGDLSLSQEEWEAMKEPNEPLGERIVECTLDQDHKWRFLRFRDDKKESNHVSVAEKVIESIQDAVSREDLVRQQGRIRDEWKKRQQAAAEEQARQEQDVRRSAAAAAQKRGASGQLGDLVTDSGAVKRKFEGIDQNGTNGGAS